MDHLSWAHSRVSLEAQRTCCSKAFSNRLDRSKTMCGAFEHYDSVRHKVASWDLKSPLILSSWLYKVRSQSIPQWNWVIGNSWCHTETQWWCASEEIYALGNTHPRYGSKGSGTRVPHLVSKRRITVGTQSKSTLPVPTWTCTENTWSLC